NNPTVLSGEIQQDNDPSNNTNNIFYNHKVDATCILDGFVLSGSALGAMFNDSASPVIANCVFKDNRAPYSGGAVYNSGSNPSFSNVLFYNNNAGAGGAVFNTGSSPVLINCTFANNYSPSGAAMFNQTNSFANLANCIVWGNTGSASILSTVTSPA